MHNLSITISFLIFTATLGVSQSNKERLIMVMEQNKFLNEKLKSLSDKVENQEKVIWSFENKIKNLENKISQLETIKNISSDGKQQQIQPVKNEESKPNPEKNKEQPRNFGQCKATTSKGTQCSRQGGATGYCWQHAK